MIQMKHSETRNTSTQAQGLQKVNSPEFQSRFKFVRILSCQFRIPCRPVITLAEQMERT